MSSQSAPNNPKVVAIDLSTLMAQTRKKRVVSKNAKNTTTTTSDSLGKGVGSDGNNSTNKNNNSSSSSSIRMAPFTRRYAPKRLEEVQDQKEVVDTMIRYTCNVPHSAYAMPHMLLFGPPGVGKTTLVDLVVRQLFPDKEVRAGSVLKMNASDERGIHAVRTRIRDFIAIEPLSGAPFRLVVLDECDNMTSSAQFALRRMMEPNVAIPAQNKPRFFLMCNYVSKVIAPLVSRCHRVRFAPISADSMTRYLTDISDRENWRHNAPVIDEIVRVSQGDMRQALTLTQSVYKLWGDGARPEHVADAAGQVPDALIENLLNAALDGTSSIQQVKEMCRKLLLREAFCGESVLKQLVAKVVEDARLSELAKARACERIAQAEYAMKKSADDYLQVVSVATQLRSFARKYPPKTDRSAERKFELKIKPLAL